MSAVTDIATQCILGAVEIGDREARAARSAALFNNSHFAEVAARVADLSRAHGGMVTTRMVASVSGLADSIVRPVLLRLVDAGVLGKLPRAGSGRSPQFYSVQALEALVVINRLADGSIPAADQQSNNQPHQ